MGGGVKPYENHSQIVVTSASCGKQDSVLVPTFLRHGAGGRGAKRHPPTTAFFHCPSFFFLSFSSRVKVFSALPGPRAADQRSSFLLKSRSMENPRGRTVFGDDFFEWGWGTPLFPTRLGRGRAHFLTSFAHRWPRAAARAPCSGCAPCRSGGCGAAARPGAVRARKEEKGKWGIVFWL